MWAAVLSAALPFAAKAIGGLFGSKPKQIKPAKPQVSHSTSSIDFKKMVRDAEAAGFNPLTVLRNGASAGYVSSTSTTHMAQAPVFSSPSKFSTFMGDAVDAFAAGASAFLNFDPHSDRRRELEFGLVEAQLANLQADTAYRTKSMKLLGVPTWSAGDKYRPMGGGVSSSGAPAPRPLESADVTSTNPFKFWRTDSGAADAEIYETRYGDVLGGLIGGALTFGADVKANWDYYTGDMSWPSLSKPVLPNWQATPAGVPNVQPPLRFTPYRSR